MYSNDVSPIQVIGIIGFSQVNVSRLKKSESETSLRMPQLIKQEMKVLCQNILHFWNGKCESQRWKS